MTTKIQSNDLASGVISGSGGSGGGDTAAQYLVLSLTSSLSGERQLSLASGLSGSDGGAGSTFSVGVDGTVARISGSAFTGNISAPVGTFSSGISGSLTRLSDGTSYIAAGANITISSASNGQVVISAQTGSSSGGDPNPSYIVLGTTSSLPNERVLTAGTGIASADGGAGSTLTLSVNDSVVAMVSGTRFSGPIQATTASFTQGLSGSLTRLTDGSSFIQAGQNVTVTSSSNGSITISAQTGSSSGTGADPQASFITVATTSSLANERALAVGSGLTLTDGGAGGSITAALDGTVARISGSYFQGSIRASASGTFGTKTEVLTSSVEPSPRVSGDRVAQWSGQFAGRPVVMVQDAATGVMPPRTSYPLMFPGFGERLYRFGSQITATQTGSYGIPFSALGTMTFPAITGTVARNAMPAVDFTSPGGTRQYCGVFAGTGTTGFGIFLRGTQPGIGGFTGHWRISPALNTSSASVFFGYGQPYTGGVATPSTRNNHIGLSYDPTDSPAGNMYITCRNNVTGWRIDTGVPRNSSDIWDFLVHSPTAGNFIGVRLNNITSGTQVGDWALMTGSYPIPEPDVVMTLECYMETGTDTTARTLRIYDIDGVLGSRMW